MSNHSQKCPTLDCQHTNRVGAKFCAQCGAALPIVAESAENRRDIPLAMLVGLTALALMVAVQLILAVTSASWSLLIASLMGAGLWIGLYWGHRWAYVLTVFFCLIGPIAVGVRNGLPRGALVLMVNCLVLVPVLLSTSFFWGSKPSQSGAQSENSADW